jgi:hypothetical protein
VGVVLNHQDGPAGFDQGLEYANQALDILQMQPD